MPKKDPVLKPDKPEKGGGGGGDKDKPGMGRGGGGGGGGDTGGEDGGDNELVITPQTGALENQAGTLSRGKILGNVFGLK